MKIISDEEVAKLSPVKREVYYKRLHRYVPRVEVVLPNYRGQILAVDTISGRYFMSSRTRIAEAQKIYAEALEHHQKLEANWKASYGES